MEYTSADSQVMENINMKSVKDINTLSTETPVTTTSPPITEEHKKTNVPIVKSRKRASLKEFATKKRLRREVLAGFKAWLRVDQFHFDSEWEALFSEYTNRKI